MTSVAFTACAWIETSRYGADRHTWDVPWQLYSSAAMVRIHVDRSTMDRQLTGFTDGLDSPGIDARRFGSNKSLSAVILSTSCRRDTRQALEARNILRSRFPCAVRTGVDPWLRPRLSPSSCLLDEL